MKNISIKRGEELDLDIGDIEIEETKVGRVVFSVTPSNASVYVDGELVDVAAPLELEYGIHQMIAGAEGYDTMTRYINVGEELANLDITALRIARYEIYARHNRKFSDPTVQKYFDSRVWYSGTIEANVFDESQLSDVEKENIRTIFQCEIEQGYF